MPVGSLASPHQDGDPPVITGAHDADREWVAPDAPPDVGLAGLRTHLARVLTTLGLHSLTVVVDDPDLGRQAFRAGAGRVEPGIVAAGPGCSSDPPLPTDRIDAQLLVALCAASLRVDVLRDTAGDTTELVLRRLPGVYGVVLERDGGLAVCRLLASAEAPDDIARRAAEALASEPRLVVELVRDPPSAHPTAASASRSDVPADATAVHERRAGPELLSVRSVPEDGEIEVHLAVGQARAIGRAPLAGGLAGAAEAVLAGVSEIGSEPRWLTSWIRTVETTASGSFVVAVALVAPEVGSQRHGIAVGSSPIDAAARATVTALRDG